MCISFEGTNLRNSKGKNSNSKIKMKSELKTKTKMKSKWAIQLAKNSKPQVTFDVIGVLMFN